MFGKVLEKIEEKLIERVTALRFGWPLLLLLGTLGVAYLVVSALRTTPAVFETFHDPLFLIAAIAATATFVSYVIWRSLRSPILIRLGITAAIAAIAIYASWKTTEVETVGFRIDVIFDLNIDPSLLAAFFAGLPQDHIKVTVRDRRVLGPSDADQVVYEQLAKEVLPKLRPPELSTHTALVTHRHLSGGRWTNLFYFAGPRFGIVSTWGMPTDVSLLQKYLAVMIPLIAMQGQAFAINKKLPKERDPDLDHGCLSDFSVDRTILIAKLRQGPALCKEEYEEIEALFGSAVAAEYKAILARSATTKGPP